MLIEIGDKFGDWTVIDSQHYKNKHPYFTCRCSCGREYDVRKDGLVKGTSTRCILCKHRHHSEIMKKPDTGWNIHYYRYQNNAKTRATPFELSKQEFRAICIQDCVYCGDSPVDNQLQGTITIATNGIDRVDSSQGYTLENCVPCCSICNMMKRDLSREFFLNHANKIKRKSD